MRLSFSRPQRPHTIYVLKSFRDKSGKSTTVRVETLGSEEEIEKKHNCADGLAWAKAYVEKLNEEERIGKQRIKIELAPNAELDPTEIPLRNGGDLLLLPLYNQLGLPQICNEIKENSRVKYDLNEILQTLVLGRILFSSSKTGTYRKAKSMIKPPKFAEHDMFRALTQLSEHINDIQAEVYHNSLNIMPRRDKVIFYDCTNFYFEIEDADKDVIDKETGEFIEGLRKQGKSKEHRPNPIVQMGMFMDYDGIPLAFCIFPGNQSEQTSLQPLEEVLQTKFGLTDFIVSTDAGLGSESNRRYNMAGNRQYITVQSLKSMKSKDIDMALDPRGWRIGYSDNDNLHTLSQANDGIFNLNELLNREEAKELLHNTTFYKEILVEKELKEEQSNRTIRRTERIIVTYSHDYALYQKAKRAEQLNRAEKMAKNKSTKSRQTQQDARRFVEVSHLTTDGQKAVKVETSVKYALAEQEARFDGFYAYGTSLDDEPLEILRVRKFHHEIEHLFRTSKTHFEARPIYVSRQDRIRSHFLICFLAMTIIKILQNQLNIPEMSIDQLISTIQNTKFDYFKGIGYRPLWQENPIIKAIEQRNGINISKQFIDYKTMNKLYRSVKAS